MIVRNATFCSRVRRFRSVWVAPSKVLVEDEVADTRHPEPAAPDQPHEPSSREVDCVARHVEMEPTSPADACLKAVEIRYRDDDPAAAAERLDRAAQAEFGVVEVLEHVPEDDDVGTLREGAERLDRRVENFEPCVRLPCVRLEPHDLAVLVGQLAEKPAVTRTDFDHPRSRSKWAERTEDCSLPEAAQRLEQLVDDSGRLGVGAVAVQASGVTSGATHRHSRAARAAAIQAVERRRRPPVSSAY